MNKAEGEFKVNFLGVDYPLKWSNRVYNAFKDATGKDFYSLSTKMINEWSLMKDLGYFDDNSDPAIAENEAAARFTEIVDKPTVATLFYLAAKEMNSKVEDAEMQENITFEHFDEVCFQVGATSRFVNNEWTEGYQVRFFEFVIFTLNMIKDSNETKKKVSKQSFLRRCFSNL